MSKPFHLSTRYPSSVQGLLKIFEFLMMVISVASILQYNKVNTVPIPSRELFFLCVCLSGLFFVVFIYWIKLFHLDRILFSKTSFFNIWSNVIELVMALLCCVAAGLLFDLIHEHESGKDMWLFVHLLVAAVFCLITALMFLVGSSLGLYYLMKNRKNESLTREVHGYDHEDSFVGQNNNN